jgi:hypothetical protein
MWIFAIFWRPNVPVSWLPGASKVLFIHAEKAHGVSPGLAKPAMGAARQVIGTSRPRSPLPGADGFGTAHDLLPDRIGLSKQFIVYTSG